MSSRPSKWLVAAALLCSPVAMANVNTGNMPDLGYPEPNWYPIRQGRASDSAVQVNETTTVWGDIEPYSAANASLCKWFNTVENGGRGTCKTDISWIHSAVGLARSVFLDPVVNYILRFHLEGACYRSTQYSDNDAAQYCAPWWWDAATNTKILTNTTCYEITQQVIDQFTGQPVLRKWGCAHKAPFGGPVDTNDTLVAPPDDGTSNFTSVGATAAPPNSFQPVATSLPPGAPVAVPVAAPAVPVTVTTGPSAVTPAAATAPTVVGVAPAVEPPATNTSANTTAPADTNATTPAPAPVPATTTTTSNTTTPAAPAAEPSPAPTTEAPATVPATAPEPPAAPAPATAGRRLQQALNNLAEPDTNGTATGTQTLTGNGTVDGTVTTPPANASEPAAQANATTPPAAPAAVVAGPTAAGPVAAAPVATAPVATAPVATAPVATAPAAVTTAPATVPAVAPTAPVAPVAPVAPATAAPAPLGFPTAAEDPSVSTTTAVSQGQAISSRADFVKLFEVYNQDGLEGWPTRQQWYACQDFTEPFSVGRETCYREAFGKNFGLNAVVLRSMLQIMRFDIANCYGNFAINGESQGQVPNKQWCEVDTANWIITNTLPQNNITGTPQQPMSLDPTVTAPPPPPPPPPPFPPPPMVEPLQQVAVDDPFAPVTATTPSGTRGFGAGAGAGAASASPGESSIVDEDAAHSMAAAAATVLAAAAAAALLL